MGKLWTTRNGRRVRTAEGLRHQAKKWDSTSEYKKKRAVRNAARRAAMREGLVHKGDNKDVDHKQGVNAGNSKSNTRVMAASKNRGRAQGSRKRGSARNRSHWGRV